MNQVISTDETGAKEDMGKMDMAMHFIQQGISGKEKKMVSALNKLFKEKLWKM